MLFSNSITQLPNQVIFSETVIKEVKSTKFLGITIIDNKLSWKYHIDNVCKNCIKEYWNHQSCKTISPIVSTPYVIFNFYFTIP